MTTNQQRRFYFPRWNECAAANRWVMQHGRLVADLPDQALDYARWPEMARELYVKVLITAEQLALQEHRATNAADLRHGCNWVATSSLPHGRATMSSTSMSGDQLNRCVDLFELFKDPTSLQAISDWLNPGQSRKRNYVAYLERTRREAVLIAISRNRWGNGDWRDRSMDDLLWLGRAASPHSSTRSKRPDPELEPF